VRLMFTTGARAGEVVAMQVNDLNLRSVPPTAIIGLGKGDKSRVIPSAVEAAAAIDKYTRARRTHRLKDDPALWLGDRGKHVSYDALHKTLAMRAAMADIDGFHPHRLRHTAAHRWLSKGGSESGLMAVAGWSRPDMLMRYTNARASARAAEEAQPIPRLTEILRRGLLSKVGIFEGWCENGDRLFQVVKLHGRPLALAQVMSLTPPESPNPRRGTRAAHRADYEAAWLDLSSDAYFVPIMVPPEESCKHRQ
jgi:Phage integrase family